MSFWGSGVLASAIAVFGYVKIFNTAYLDVESSLQNGGTQQIFFDTGAGISEESSVRTFLEVPYKTYRYKVPLPKKPLLQLRLDPADTEGWVQFDRFEMKPKGFWRGLPLLKEDAPTSGIRELVFDVDLDQWTISSEYGNTDPHLLLTSVPEELSGRALLHKKVQIIALLIPLIVIAAYLGEFLSKFTIQGISQLGSPFKIFQSKAFNYSTVSVLVLGIAFAFVVVTSGGLSKQSVLTFSWSGYPTEFVQLSYDSGDGFSAENTRIFWNREGSREFDVTFHLNEKHIRKLRFQTEGSKEEGILSELRFKQAGNSNAERIDSSRWTAKTTDLQIQQKDGNLYFIGKDGTDSVFESDILSGF